MQAKILFSNICNFIIFSHKYGILGLGLELWCLMPLSVIFLLYHSGEETGVPRENHRPAASYWQTLSHNVSSTPCHEFELTTLVVIGTDCIGSCKSNFHTN